MSSGILFINREFRVAMIILHMQGTRAHSLLLPRVCQIEALITGLYTLACMLLYVLQSVVAEHSQPCLQLA